MSTLNNRAPRFRTQSSAQSSAPSAFAQTLDVPPRLATTLATPSVTPITTPLGTVPPPYSHLGVGAGASSRQLGSRYGGADALGPAFVEDEEDDANVLATKMAAFGLDPQGVPCYNSSVAAAELQRRIQAQQFLQLQLLKEQQQNASTLQAMLLQSNDPNKLREAMALLELQQAQQAATTPPVHLDRVFGQNAALQHQQQVAVQLALQQQPVYQRNAYRRALQQQILTLQAEYASAALGHRQALTAQLEAGTLRRERERAHPMGPDHPQVRAAFERTQPVSPDDPKVRAAFERGGQQFSYNRARTPLDNSGGYFPPISPPTESAAGVGWTSSISTGPSEWHNNGFVAPTGTGLHAMTPARSSSPAFAGAGTPPVAAPAALGRFAKARQDLAAAQAAAPGATPLAALLSRRRAAEDDTVSQSSIPETALTSPASDVAVDWHERRDPRERKWSWESSSISDRTWSTESASSVRTPADHKWPTESSAGRRAVVSDSGHTFVKEPLSYLDWVNGRPAPRSASFSGQRPIPSEGFLRGSSSMGPATPVNLIIRQPYGPPGSLDEITEKNFASIQRRKAGQNLGMLNRRTETA